VRGGEGGNTEEESERGGGRGGCVFETRKESTGRKRADLTIPLSFSLSLFLSLACSYTGSPNTRREKT